MAAKRHVVILGCGFTGTRVAERFLARGFRVSAATRKRPPSGVDWIGGDLRNIGGAFSSGCLVLHSLPTLEGGLDTTILQQAAGAPSRVVYLSTTGVYGEAAKVDENTSPAPRNPRACARTATENAISAGPWKALILRPAGIYGPGRGIHVSVTNGSFRRPENAVAFVSRIHVDDLAAHVEAALLSDWTGAYPVADEHPCPTEEIALFCANLLGVRLPPAGEGEATSARRANRQVDGSAIRRLLGIKLQYPSYREGIPACLEPLPAQAIITSTP